MMCQHGCIAKYLSNEYQINIPLLITVKYEKTEIRNTDTLRLKAQCQFRSIKIRYTWMARTHLIKFTGTLHREHVHGHEHTTQAGSTYQQVEPFVLLPCPIFLDISAHTVAIIIG
jgi:hypothetical protein